jgi:hypothetical protein
MNEKFHQSFDYEIIDAKKRPERADRLINFLEHSRIIDFAKDTVENNKLENIKYDDLKFFLIRINGIIREIPIHEREFDGKNVQSVEYHGPHQAVTLFPKFEDKEDLLKYLSDSLGEINKKDLKYAIPAVLIAIHPFADGNGRTSRVLYELFSDSDSKESLKQNLKKALTKNKYGETESHKVDPGLISEEIDWLVLKDHNWVFNKRGFPESVGVVNTPSWDEIVKLINRYQKTGIYYPRELYNDKLNFMFAIRGNDKYLAVTAINDIARERQKESNKIIPNMKKNKQNVDKIDKVNFTELVDSLTNIEWKSLMNEFYKLKKEYVMKLVDIFARPEKNIDYPGTESILLKDLFIKWVNEENKKKRVELEQNVI